MDSLAARLIFALILLGSVYPALAVIAFYASILFYFKRGKQLAALYLGPLLIMLTMVPLIKPVLGNENLLAAVIYSIVYILFFFLHYPITFIYTIIFLVKRRKQKTLPPQIVQPPLQ